MKVTPIRLRGLTFLVWALLPAIATGATAATLASSGTLSPTGMLVLTGSVSWVAVLLRLKLEANDQELIVRNIRTHRIKWEDVGDLDVGAWPTPFTGANQYPVVRVGTTTGERIRAVSTQGASSSSIGDLVATARRKSPGLRVSGLVNTWQPWRRAWNTDTTDHSSG